MLLLGAAYDDATGHAVIDSRGGIWTKSVVQRRARLPIKQDNETNASISNSRDRPFELSQSEYLEQPKEFDKND
jgi:hypothetical protein